MSELLTPIIVAVHLMIAVALIVGTAELLGLLADQLGWHGPFWEWLGGLDLNTVGFVVVGMFVAVVTDSGIDLNNLTGVGDPEEVRGLTVTDGVLPMLGVRPIIQRVSTPCGWGGIVSAP